MAQFEVFALPDGGLVIDVQSDLIGVYGTRLVVPLIRPDDDARPVERLNPTLVIDGETWLLATHLASAVTRSQLQRRVASATEHDLVIKAALDMLISGF